MYAICVMFIIELIKSDKAEQKTLSKQVITSIRLRLLTGNMFTITVRIYTQSVGSVNIPE